MVVGTWNTTKSRENAPTGNDKFGCPCGRSPTGKCIGWHRLNDAGYVDMYAKYQKVPVNEREEFFKNNKVPKKKAVNPDSTVLFDLHNINRMESDDFDPGQE